MSSTVTGSSGGTAENTVRAIVPRCEGGGGTWQSLRTKLEVRSLGGRDGGGCCEGEVLWQGGGSHQNESNKRQLCF